MIKHPKTKTKTKTHIKTKTNKQKLIFTFIQILTQKDLNVIHKTIELLEENTGINLHDLELAKSLTGFRTPYPKIRPIDIPNIFGWRNLRKHRGRRDIFPEAGHKMLMGEVPSLPLEERSILISEDGGECRGIWMKLLFPPVYYLWLIPFGPITFSHDFPLFIKSNINMLRFNCSFEFSFPYEVSHVT